MHLDRRDKDNNYYAELQASALAMLQQLSGQVWTDFNPHDPGVTTLDLLNYALTELDYQLQFPLQDYLQGADYEQIGLFDWDTLFGDSVVTSQDYEMLFENRVPGVVLCRALVTPEGVYHFRLQVDRPGTESEVERLYHSHRNLNENLGSITIGPVQKPPYPIAFGSPKRDRQRAAPPPAARQLPKGYRPLRLDFPDCYGINERGSHSDIPPERQARINQFKGYLAIFDLLLGSVRVQAGNLSRLLSLSGRIPPNTLPEQVDGGTGLIDYERLSALRSGNVGFMEEQKSRYFDALDTLYGESTRDGLSFSPTSSDPDRRADLIRRLPGLNAVRFRSFNLQDPSFESLPGIKSMIAAWLGIDLRKESPLSNWLGHCNLRLIDDELFFGDQKNGTNVEFMFRDAEHNWQQQQVFPVPSVDIHMAQHQWLSLKKHLNIFWHHTLFESFVLYGRSLEHYRIVHWPENEGYLLVFRHPVRNKWINLGFFDAQNELIETANILRGFLEEVHLQSGTFHVIEHLLLTDRKPEACLTLVFPRWTEQYGNREEYTTFIGERLPVHLSVSYRWLHAGAWYRFEELYYAWRKAWASDEAPRTESLSAQIRQLLDQNNPAR